VETLAVTEGKLEDAIVRGEDEDVTGGVEDSGTDLAVRQMLFDVDAGLGVEGVVEIAGDVVPDMAAVQNHGNLLRRVGAALASCGASCFCSIMRAR